MILVVMGAAGAGKTTVGKLLAGRLGWTFVDADDLHPPENVAKMAAGVPLTDADRQPWLDLLRTSIEQAAAADENLVLACSALKEAYRQFLAGTSPPPRFVYLKASAELLRQRLAARQGHFMKQRMIESQLEALEEPGEALVLDASVAPVDLVVAIQKWAHPQS